MGLNGSSAEFLYGEGSSVDHPREIRDPFGRAVTFSYMGGTLSTIEDAAGNRTSLNYLNSNLTSIQWADSSLLSFVYDHPMFGWALTGKIDENNRRTSTYGYSALGQANLSERAGGVNRYSVSFSQAPKVNVNDVLDDAGGRWIRTLSWEPAAASSVTGPLAEAVAIQGNPASGLVSQSQPSGSGCAVSTTTQTFDANGNAASRDDFNGTRVCYANDLSRNLELVRMEGLPAGGSCAGTAAGALLSRDVQKITTQWHPWWRLTTKVAQPRRMITSVYNGQPDPLAGGAIAWCAPLSAALPDGQPIAVLCRKVEQATTDPSGSMGFSAALEPGAAWREERWTYNEYGQVLTHDGPRTDVTDITINEYHTNTSFTGANPNAVGHTRGDLRKTTNPAGHFTLYTLYNKLGQPLETRDANNVVTTYAYDARSRMTRTTVAGQTTTMDYWPTGLIKQITQPDNSWIFYEYDDAHRQRAVSDDQGNRIEYVLDNAGNRKEERVRDPGGNLRRMLTRSMDALGRVQQVTGLE